MTPATWPYPTSPPEAPAARRRAYPTRPADCAVRTLTPAPACLSLTAAKAHLAVTHDADDELIADLVTDAQAAVEAAADVRIGRQTVEVTFAAFPAGPVAFPAGPLLAVTAFEADGPDGRPAALPATVVVADPAAIHAAGSGWPATAGRPDAVRITADVGLEDSALARRAVKLLVGAWYEGRGDGRDPAGPGGSGLPAAAERRVTLLRSGGYR